MEIDYKMASETEAEYLEERLASYNESQQRVLQTEAYKKFVVTASMAGEIVGGGIAYASLYYIGYLDTLWVAESARNKSIGSQLLASLEARLKEYGCDNCHLETFDFQAPSFYQAHGYQELGKIYHPKSQLTEYFFTKRL